LRKLGRYDEALKHFDRALALNPNYIKAPCRGSKTRPSAASGLSSGRNVDRSTLARLQVAAEGLTEETGDPGLDLIMGEIDLRGRSGTWQNRRPLKMGTGSSLGELH
jgi:tetratricopeptide (TPR) repeat protein